VQVLDHVSAGGSKSGIRYAVGPDDLTGQVNILWVDWPKSIFSIEELRDSPQSAKFFAGCNVCSAINQIRNAEPEVVPADLQVPIVPSASQSPPQLQPARLSAGDLVLPKYVPVAFNLAKSIFLNPLGDVAVSLAASFAADLLSGFFDDPKYRSALQCASDQMIEGVSECVTDPKYVERVKDDIVKVSDAYKKDNDVLNAVIAGMVRPTSDVIGVRKSGTHNIKSSIGRSILYNPRID
jgi:hypothetical protein